MIKISPPALAGFLSCIALFLILPGCGERTDKSDALKKQVDAAEYAEEIFVNGRIYTVNEEMPWAESIAVANGQILAVGEAEQVLAYRGPKTQMTDLNNRMVMPGIHDSHAHMEMAGVLNTHECVLPDAALPEQIIETLKACEVRRPEGWLTAGLYLPLVFPGNRPNNQFLNEAFPDTPVFLLDYSAHHGLANAKALALAGIDRDTPDPSGGRIVRDPETDELTGELVETAGSLIVRGLPYYQSEVYQKALAWAVKSANSYGVTSIQEASANRRLLTILNAMDAEGALSLNVAAHLIWQYEKFAEAPLDEIRQLIDDREQYASPHVDTRFIKIWLDGAPLPPNMTQSSLDEHGHVDAEKLLIPAEELHKTVALMDSRGLTLKMHVAGDGAAKTALDAIAYTRQQNGDSGLLHELAHAGFIAPDDISRMHALGAVAEMSPAIWHKGSVAYDALKDGFKFRTLKDHQVTTVMGSDWWLTPTPNLFPAIEGMLDRGEESIDLATALKIVTANGAAVTRGDDRYGSLAPGKDATFIVLDRNLFEVPVQDISDTTVLMTVFEGAVVYVAD